MLPPLCEINVVTEFLCLLENTTFIISGEIIYLLIILLHVQSASRQSNTSNMFVSERSNKSITFDLERSYKSSFLNQNGLINQFVIRFRSVH